MDCITQTHLIRGFGGRDNSDRGGFGDRGRSDRGGFRGRGRFNSGGFRGRGGGRDQSGDWNSGYSNEAWKGDWNPSNRTDEKKSFDCGKESNSNGNGTSEKSRDWSKLENDKREGWQSHSATQSRNEGGQSSSKPPSASSDSQGYGWNQSANNEAFGMTQTHLIRVRLGWNKGSAANEASGGTGTQGNDWSTTKASAGDWSSGWKSGMGAGFGSSDWDSKDCWGDGNADEAKHSGCNSNPVENVKNSEANNEKSNNSNGSWGSRSPVLLVRSPVTGVNRTMIKARVGKVTANN